MSFSSLLKRDVGSSYLMVLVSLCLLNTACQANQKSHEYLEVCQKIEEIHANGTVRDNFVHALPDHNIDLPFQIDIDNDGKDEELRYSSYRNAVYIDIFSNDKKLWRSSPSLPTAILASNIININDVFYIYNWVGGQSYELLSVYDKSDATSDLPDYMSELLCKKYD